MTATEQHPDHVPNAQRSKQATTEQASTEQEGTAPATPRREVPHRQPLATVPGSERITAGRIERYDHVHDNGTVTVVEHDLDTGETRYLNPATGRFERRG